MQKKVAVEAKPVVPPPPPEPLAIPAVSGGRVGRDDPAWVAADSYRLSPAEYGQPDWDHVRLAAVSHIAISGRDLARNDAARGDFKECATAYLAAAGRVRAVPLSGATVTPVRDVLASGLERDGALCAALATRTVPAATGPSLSAMRLRYYALALRAEKGEDVREGARTLSAGVAAAAQSFDSAPGASAAPAEKALWLARAWDDTVDPLVVTEAWGAWTPAERRRQMEGLSAALTAIGSGETKGLFHRPAAALVPQRVAWTADEFAGIALPDPWVDVGGFGAPVVTPQPEYADAAAFRALAERLAVRWGTLREGEVPRAVRSEVAKLGDRPEGERYYQALALQNGAIRQLSRRGHFFEALLVLLEQSPPSGLDWFAPDRQGALIGLEGRLRLLSGDKDATKRLHAAMTESESFLAFVLMREGLDIKAAPAH